MAYQSNLTRQQIQASNARIDAGSYPRTAVFVGGTSGIGEATIQELVEAGANDKFPIRIHILGRRESAERANKSLDKLKAQNPHAELIFTRCDVSLLCDVNEFCTELKRKEKSLDLLFLSTGYSPFGGREETFEDLVISQSLGYYSRFVFIQHLLPLLKSSPNKKGRIVSLLGAGNETANINLDDLNLEKPGNWGGYKIMGHTVTMMTMSMERLAEENQDVTFIHASPGLVNTGNLNRGWQDHWIFQALANIVLAPAFLLIAMSIKQSSERMVYMITSGKFGGCGVGLGEGVVNGVTTRGEEKGGLFLVGWKQASMLNEGALAKLRGEPQERIWDKTMEVVGGYL